MSSTTPVGTIAYIIDEEALLVRVNKGWQYIAVSLCTRIGIHSDNYYYTYISGLCITSLLAGYIGSHCNALTTYNGSAATTTAAPSRHAGIEFIDEWTGL